MSLEFEDRLEVLDAHGAGDHAGPWPAFVDLFAATALIMLLFFAVLAFGYIRASSTGVQVEELYNDLNKLAQDQQTFSVSKVGPDVLIVLEENVTFPRSHSSLDSLKTAGRATLRTIGGLTKKPEFQGLIREIEVVGHADRTQYPRNSGLTNWGISTARAATVAQFMVDSVGLDPCIVIPSGRGEYFPRDTTVRVRVNATDALDRRIEVLLHPTMQGTPSVGRRGCRRTGR